MPIISFADLDAAAAQKYIDRGVIVAIAIVDAGQPTAFASIASGQAEFGSLVRKK